MDKYLQDIVRDKRYWEAKRDNIRRQEKRLNDLASQYEQNMETAEKQRKEIIRAAREEAERLLAAANAQIENTIREIREAQAEREQTRLARRALDEFKAAVLQAGENDAKAAAVLNPHRKRKANASPSLLPDAPLKAGDPVRLKGQTYAGTLLEVQGKRAIVAFGMMKTATPLDKLERAGREQIGREIRKDAFAGNRPSDRIREKKLNFKPEVDVRGMRGDDALQAVAGFIDDAILVGVSPVRILHGTGGGVLRQLIREYLPAVAGVSRCYDEHVQFGGAGITVVELA
jgi:DNA mismatch repair protein MutS2